MRTVATLIVSGLLIAGMAGHRAVTASAASDGPPMVNRTVDRDRERLLQTFADAWNRHDVDALMSMMTSDCVFEASGGNMVDGERHEGQRAVRAAYAAVFEQYPDAHWGNARHFVSGDRGVSEWTFTGTLKDGKRVEVTGCDLFTFRNGKIAIKNSFRKNRPPIG
jgi:taurine dehydrogenase small subunit